MSKTKNVPASAVRAWFAETKPEGVTAPGSRGRLAPDTIKAFHKANKGKRYEPRVAEGATITVPVKMLDSLGRATTRKVTLPTTEARALLGHEKGRRGKFNRSDLSLALEARSLQDA